MNEWSVESNINSFRENNKEELFLEDALRLMACISSDVEKYNLSKNPELKKTKYDYTDIKINNSEEFVSSILKILNYCNLVIKNNKYAINAIQGDIMADDLQDLDREIEEKNKKLKNKKAEFEKREKIADLDIQISDIEKEIAEYDKKKKKLNDLKERQDNLKNDIDEVSNRFSIIENAAKSLMEEISPQEKATEASDKEGLNDSFEFLVGKMAELKATYKDYLTVLSMEVTK